MRVVIADDEKYIRLVLKDTLQHLSIPVDIIGEAKDGREAYEICCTDKPDILITDVCMPEEDGFTLLEKVRQELPELPVIIYSGYDDFSYAQRAIHYRVEEYLLKPIDEEKLENAIRKIQKHQKGGLLEKRSIVRNEILRGIAKSRRSERIFNHMDKLFDDDEQEFLVTARGCSMELFYQKGLGSMERTRWEDFFSGHTVHSWCLEEEQGFLLVVCNPGDREAVRLEAEEIWEKDSWSHEFCLLSEESMEHSLRYREMRKRWSQMDEIMQFYFWDNPKDNTEECIEAFTDRVGEQYNQKYVGQVMAAIRLGKKDYLKKSLKEYWDGLLQLFDQTSPSLVKSTMKNLLGREMLQLNLSFEACEEVAAYMKRVSRILKSEQVYELMMDCADLLMELYRQEHKGSTVDNTKEVIEDYLAEHYNQDITLEQLAEYLHFNANYTSGLFKKIFGKTFVSYLTDIRMEAAKTLLDSENFKVYEIARQVGYEDERYFQKTFKKVTGMTPKEYQRKKEWTK